MELVQTSNIRTLIKLSHKVSVRTIHPTSAMFALDAKYLKNREKQIPFINVEHCGISLSPWIPL